MIDGKVVLITGGTGTFGKSFVRHILTHYKPKKIIIYSRDEFKQFNMRNEFKDYDDIMRFFIGDVRDKDRLKLALDGVDYVIHAAALKQVPACEYNPMEAIKTNIIGASNIVETTIKSGVQKVVALSTDKAVNPVNLYGATKLSSDKLFISANGYTKDTCYSVVRYGNVAGSRGSVIPFFKSLVSEGKKTLPLTDIEMTRFYITIQEAVDLVIYALENASGGETFISKIPSFRIVDLITALECGYNIVGIREGEKLHEVMIAETDFNTYEYQKNYVIYPNFDWFTNTLIPNGKKVKAGFVYSSGNNEKFLSINEIKEVINGIDY